MVAISPPLWIRIVVRTSYRFYYIIIFSYEPRTAHIVEGTYYGLLLQFFGHPNWGKKCVLLLIISWSDKPKTFLLLFYLIIDTRLIGKINNKWPDCIFILGHTSSSIIFQLAYHYYIMIFLIGS
jgi:hypothetical protein